MNFRERYLLQEEDTSSNPVSSIESSGPSATEQALTNDVTKEVTPQATETKAPSLGGAEVTKAPEKSSGFLENRLRPKADNSPSLGDSQKFQNLVNRLSGRKE